MQAQKAAGRSATTVTAQSAEAMIVARERAAQAAKRTIRALWAQTNPYDEASVARFAASAAKIMQSAQTAAGRAAAAGMAQQLAAVGIKVAPVTTYPVNIRAAGIDVGDDGKITLVHKPTTVDYSASPGRGKIIVTPHGSTTEEVFKRPAREFRFAQSEGHSGHDAAHDRIDSLIDTNLMLAQRLAQQELLAKAALPPPVMLDSGKPYRYIDYSGRTQYVREASKVIGYRRVIHPELSRGGTCGMCIVAADRIYHIHDLLPIHDNCHCTVSPVTKDHDPGNSLNDQDLKKFYGDAGGNTRAHLKRTRYQVDEHGELGAVLVPKKPYRPRSANSKRIVGGKRISRSSRTHESAADVARRNLPILEKNLERLRRKGLDEKSSQIQYHLRTIARMRDALK